MSCIPAAHVPIQPIEAHEGELWPASGSVPADVRLVPPAGHTVGHTGVAVRDGDGWLLHAGDAYFHHGEMHPDAPRCPPGLRYMQARMETARGLRLANQDRLRELVREHGDRITVFSAHDAAELRATQRQRVS
ncbi:hypothetical protein GCM10023320_22990 [Pseudonocardia adelaidensis]|uniref:Metallo-beta-lactamase domain-containing protein n=1 Tax=Pseudonocardia adelaidensis TaxID=648754 RepID=A0ABP9NG57_9PSEU